MVMKKNDTWIVMAAMIIVVIGGIFVYAKNQLSDGYVIDSSDFIKPHNLVDSLPVEELTEAEKDGLIVMREEEKLAHDVYAVLYNQWNLKIFNNIAKSEQTHTDAVKFLLERYGLSDPVIDDTVGVFTNSDFSKLYADLINQGSTSLLDALVVGATIEDLDIKDLQDYIIQTNNEDIIRVYENLMKGSRNHMRAFVGQIRDRGGEYMAQYISQSEINEILSREQELGSV